MKDIKKKKNIYLAYYQPKLKRNFLSIREKVMLSVDYGKGVGVSIIKAQWVSNFHLREKDV